MKLDRLFTKANSLFVLSLIFTINVLVGIYSFNRVSFSTNLEESYETNGESAVFYKSYKKHFKNTSNLSLLTVKTKDSILNYSTLSRIQTISDSISNLPHVLSVSSILSVKKLIKAPFLGYTLVPAFAIGTENNTPNYLSNLKPKWVGNLIAKNHKGFSIQVITDNSLTTDKVDSLEQSINLIMTNNQFPEYYLAGKAFGQNTILKLLKNEFLFYIFISFFLICLILFLLYRSIWSIIRPLLVLFTVLLWTIGLMIFLGIPINVFSSVVPPILFIVGVSDIVHIYERHRHERRMGETNNVAIRIALQQLGKATLITSITTMIGFLSLMTSSITPVQELGIIMAAGVAIAYVLTFSMFPALIIITPTFKPKTLNKLKPNYDFFGNMLTLVLNNKFSIKVSFLLLAVISIWGISNLKTDNFLTEELPSNSLYKAGYQYLDQEFSGARPFEIAILSKGSSTNSNNFLSFQRMSQINGLNQVVKQFYSTSHTYSVIDVIDKLAAAENISKNKKGFYDEDKYRQFIKPALSRISKSNLSEMIMNERALLFRISGHTPDAGGAKTRIINSKILKYANENCNLLDVKFTGVAHLIDESNMLVAQDMLKGLMIALLLISLVMVFLFRSIKLILIALIPNLFPLLLIGALMSILGIHLKISTALIFTLSLGIVVDDTIHFLSRMKLELNKNKSTLEALHNTYISTGKSIVITSVILSSGFICLSFSDFTSTFYMGFLVSCTLLFAVIADLTLLPILLLWLKNKNDKNQLEPTK